MSNVQHPIVDTRDQSKNLFGAFIPQGWKMELVGIEGAQAKWQKAVDMAVLAEELGYDSVWVYDHFHNVPKAAHEAVFECWTTMAAISQRTSRVRLGQMVGCNSYREPSVLAKITSTVDIISGGRLDWGIGAGWYEHEYKGYGFDFPRPAARIGMLRESVEIVKSMWTQADTSYEGTYYSLYGAQCDPKPLQSPHPPIWIGGGGEQLTLRVVARHADCANFGGKPHEWARKREILKEHCAAVGRDEATIRKTWSPEVFIRNTEAEVVAGGTRSSWGEPFESWREGNLVGTPEEVCEKIEQYIELGCTGFIPWCSDYPSTETLELFATKVIPNFR
ncbi:MAG: LLM class F420-dependent oxidoreductase [Actinomycetota bacterium]|nr:LLM class F420-dependent oxidoreductase [Actinomycetota bacterium]